MKIGLIVPLAESERRGRALSFPEIRHAALQAEAEGLDSVWVYDHLIHRFPDRPTVGFWEAWTMLSALASVTTRVELGTWVICALFRNPALLAKMADTLDEVSGGRLLLGLGAGWHQPEFDAFGIPFDHRVSRFEEALNIIVPLLRQGTVEFAGHYHRVQHGELRPRGPRPGGPPIMIGAFGPRMMRLTARYADSWNTDWLGPPTGSAHLTERLARLEAACRAEGRAPATLAIMGSATIAFPDLGPIPDWLTSPDMFLGGSPEEIAAGLRQYEALGVAHIMCECYPDSPAAISRLAEGVQSYKDDRAAATRNIDR